MPRLLGRLGIRRCTGPPAMPDRQGSTSASKQLEAGGKGKHDSDRTSRDSIEPGGHGNPEKEAPRSDPHPGRHHSSQSRRTLFRGRSVGRRRWVRERREQHHPKSTGGGRRCIAPRTRPST
eukprot:582626-Rhodomonas_salina.1